jgi:glycosyltransferase involved in cell wall biosynthesis
LARTEGLAFVLDEHNIESEYLREQDAARETLARKSHIQHGRLAAWERQVWKDAQQIVCVSDADAKLINPYATTPCEVVENGVDCAHTAFTPPSKRSSKTLLFVGSMRHPPNAQAALFLVEKVLPRVWERYPDARLVLCGHDPIREVLGLASSRVEVTGSVPSVEPYLRDAAIVLNPLERGAGTSLKVLEALAAGAPLVTTNVGVRGYPERIRSACHIADTPEQFSSSILNCLNTREAQDDKAKRGRLAALEFDWARLSERFESIVSGLGPG